MVLLRIVVALALLVLLVVSSVPAFGPWPGDMIAPFRVQLAVASLLGLVLALLARERLIFVLALVVVVGNLLPMALRLLDRPILSEPGPGTTTSLVFANVLADNTDYERVISLVRTEDSDLFAAVETTSEWVEQLQALADSYPHSFAPRTLGAFGVALYAKQPFGGSVVGVGRRELPLLRADFGDMIVYVAHPMPPATARLAADNLDYIEALAERVAAETLPVVVAGDLNTTLWSSNLAPLLRQRVQWPAGSGVAYTWPAGRPWLAIQIDHVLTLGMKAGSYRVLGDIGSDHFPVRAELMR